MRYVASKNGFPNKVAHTIACGNITKILPGNRIHFQSFEDAKAYGCVFCKSCSRIYRQLKREDIRNYSEKHDLEYKYNLKDDSIDIKSVYDQWKLAVEEKYKIMLYHKDTYTRRNIKERLRDRTLLLVFV